eukprot:3775161-Rhodomonas_salina.3
MQRCGPLQLQHPSPSLILTASDRSNLKFASPGLLAWVRALAQRPHPGLCSTHTRPLTEAALAQLLATVLRVCEEDGVPALSSGPVDIGRAVVDEQALRAVEGEARLHGLEDRGVRLAQPHVA